MIIDRELAALRPNAVVVNLGCGPNTLGSIDNLADSFASLHEGGGRLIAVDKNPGMLEAVRRTTRHRSAAQGIVLEVLMADAMNLAPNFEDSTIDLILAFGLFGDLRFEGEADDNKTEDRPGRSTAFMKVLSECYRALTDDGRLIVGNSSVRQPAESFLTLARQTGFSDVLLDDYAPPAGSPENKRDPRYLLVLRKAGD